MAIVYTEFDSDPTNIYAAVKTALLAGGDWSDISPAPVTYTYSVATATNAATFTVGSTTGLVPGQLIIVEAGTVREERRVINTITSGTTGTVTSNWGFVHAIGSTFATQDIVLQATTTRGAKMILNLTTNINGTHFMAGSFYRDWTGSAPGGWTDKQDFYLYWKGAAGTTTMPLHVTLSASTEHFFLAVEGPRASEASTTSTTYGSIKNYVFMADLVPYHAGDTIAAVVAGAPASTASAAPAVTNNSHQVYISRNAANTASWTAGRLATLSFPTIATNDVLAYQRNCAIDGNTYLFPYVVFDLAEGIRGRLNRIEYAGTTDPTIPSDYPEAVGTKLTQDSMIWKLIAPNKGDNTTQSWGPFGSISQGTSVRRSFVIAVPISAA